MVIYILALALLWASPASAASMDDLPAADDYRPRHAQEHNVAWPQTPLRRPRQPTMWKVRIEGERGDWLIPITVAKGFHLRPGQTVSLETARLIAVKMGADYPDDIREKLEKLK